jgi:hypothetical protein
VAEMRGIWCADTIFYSGEIKAVLTDERLIPEFEKQKILR